jgi:eukaryotic translation initiation factor 2C
MNSNMYLGADVSHPCPGLAKPSVMGIVFSNEGATRYAALTEIQQPRVEIIESWKKMMEAVGSEHSGVSLSSIRFHQRG